MPALRHHAQDQLHCYSSSSIHVLSIRSLSLKWKKILTTVTTLQCFWKHKWLAFFLMSKDDFLRELRNSKFHQHHPFSKADNYCRHDSLLHVLYNAIKKQHVGTWDEVKWKLSIAIIYSIAWTECACRLYMHDCQLHLYICSFETTLELHFHLSVSSFKNEVYH